MHWNRLALSSLVMAGIAAIVSGCARTEPVSVDKSLYDRLGGKAAVTTVVDQFVANVAADSRINGRFATTDFPRLKGHLVDQICMLSGGPCLYKGRDMKATHARMKITSGDFEALVEDLVAALDKFKVSAHEKGKLLGLLRPMKKDIVE